MGNVTEEDEAKANGTHLYTDYTYDAANQLTLADAPTDTYYYTYDAQGNEVTDGSKSLTYGYDNELKSYTSGSTTTNYVYDATGQRLEKNTGATPTYQYVNIGNEQVLVTKNVPSSSYNYNVYGNDMISQGDTAASTRQYFLDDGMGNVKYLTSNTGATVATYAYDPYGLQISGSTTASNFTYQNEQKDPESGLTYLRARSYDPTIARFTAQDPLSGTLGDPSTQNGYNYANNDPINMSDPTGMKSIWDNAKDITGLTTFENNIAKGCDVGSIITSGLEAAANLGTLIPGVGEGDLAVQGALRGGLAFSKVSKAEQLAINARNGKAAEALVRTP